VPVALAMLWAEPVVAVVLPAYLDGVPALRLLAFASLLVTASTLPGYFLLANGRYRRLLVVGALAVGLNALLVFGAAHRDPNPASVATATLGGYAAFAVGLVVVAAFELFARAGERFRFVATSFAPALVLGGATLLLARRFEAGTPMGAGIGSAVLLVVALPVAALFGRGLGLRSFLPGGAAAPRI
jgi:O-antigen/teichoic acid export membrane protein